MKFDFYNKLLESEVFKNWENENSGYYLVHFYCQINNSYQTNADWEIGFYNPDTDKIVIFIIGPEISIKPEEEAFKKQGKVDELNLEKLFKQQKQAIIIITHDKDVNSIFDEEIKI